MGIVLIIIFVGFIQASLYGIVKAMNFQREAMLINLVSYFLISIPFAYHLAFIYDGIGLGIKGIWIGFLAGMIH